MTFSYASIVFVDMMGSFLMILLSFMCIRISLKLRGHDSENVLWLYLLWFSLALAVFAVSRSSGHIIKNILTFTGNKDIWQILRPYSGAVNTITFIAVSAVTFFFGQIWKINTQVVMDREKLAQAHGLLLTLNETLEKRVVKRSKALLKATEKQMEMEKKMAHAEKLASIGELSAGVAHEINNPLGVILGYTQLLIREEGDVEKQEDLKTIEKHTNHCRTIVSDLLSFSRNSPGVKKPQDIHLIIEEVIGFIETKTGGDIPKIIRNFDTTLPKISIDSSKIRQVMINLLMNARHALKDGGEITITSSYNKDKAIAEILVGDNGCGIDEADISRIFDPFFTTKPTGSGTGLGLSVSYGIIKNHDGEISVASTKGKGAVFTIQLPVSE